MLKGMLERFKIKNILFVIAAIFVVVKADAQGSGASNNDAAFGNFILTGTITSVATGQPLSSIDVSIPGSAYGTVSDKYGRYKIIVKEKHSIIKFSGVGYVTQLLPIANIKTQLINVQLIRANNRLNEVVITSAKKTRYRNKDNPAVELIKRVIAHKSLNRPGDNNYLQYEQYERITMSLANLSDKFLKGNFFRKYKFLLDTIIDFDSTKLVKLPVYMSEKRSQIYYRKQPAKQITLLLAHKQVNISNFIDSAGLDIMLNRLYGDNINIYDNNIFILTNQFLSPISDHSFDYYKFFIDDTLQVNGKKFVSVSFTPRAKGDLLFEGNIQIALDSSYAVTSASLGVNKKINLNFIRNFRIHQDFERYPDGRYYLKKNDVKADFGIFKNKKFRVLGDRIVFFKNYLPGKIMADSFYRGKDVQVVDDTLSKNKTYWEAHRGDTLSKKEASIYANYDSLNKMPSYKRTIWIAKTLVGGYADLGPVELGPDEAFYSFNTVEGSRIALGGRTKPQFNKTLYLEGYGAYGFKDDIFKYYLNASYSFNHVPPFKFPNNYLRVSYQYDTSIPGVNFLIQQTQSFLASFDRTPNDFWQYDRIFKVEYVKDEESHFSYDLGFKNWQQSPADKLIFQPDIYGSKPVNDLNTSEFDIGLRYAPHEQFFQGTEERHTIPNKYPIITAQINFGVKGILNGSYNYQSLSANIYKRFYLSQLGYTDITLQGGVVLGQLPFPLLAILPANQTYLYDPNAYNMMNFLEFVTDHYAGINVTHCFSGFFLNKIPLIDGLNWREYISLKVLYGGVRNENNPAISPGLYKFPVNASGVPLTYGLGNTPYIEAGVGIGNIFKLVRVDLIRRFNYLDHPNVGAYGVRFLITPDF